MTDRPSIEMEHLYAAARETVDLLPRVRSLITDTTTALEAGAGSHRKAPAAPTPWNDLYAFTAFGIADDARRHEMVLSLALFRKVTWRARTDTAAAEGIGRLPVLIAHARDQLDEDDLAEVEHISRDLASWPRRCRTVLGELRPDEQPWSHAPGGLVCPHCDGHLWLRPGWADRRAATPELEHLWCRRCTDDDGMLLSWAPSAWTGQVLDQPEPAYRDVDGHPLVTAKQAAHRIRRLEAATVRQWASRGKITAVAATATGAKLYRLAHLEQCMQ